VSNTKKQKPGRFVKPRGGTFTLSVLVVGRTSQRLGVGPRRSPGFSVVGGHYGFGGMAGGGRIYGVDWPWGKNGGGGGDGGNVFQNPGGVVEITGSIRCISQGGPSGRGAI